jgi:hypothetical protein
VFSTGQSSQSESFLEKMRKNEKRGISLLGLTVFVFSSFFGSGLFEGFGAAGTYQAPLYLTTGCSDLPL